MKDESQRLIELYNKRLNGVLTDEETTELAALLDEENGEARLSPMLYEHWKTVFKEQPVKGFTIEQIENFLATLPEDTENRRNKGLVVSHRSTEKTTLVKWAWVAASVLCILAFPAYHFFKHRTSQRPPNTQVNSGVDIPPGTNGAVLTLADGTQVVLDSSRNGTLAQQGGAVIRLENNQLIYDLNGNASGDFLYNKISTPKGRQF